MIDGVPRLTLRLPFFEISIERITSSSLEELNKYAFKQLAFEFGRSCHGDNVK